MIVQSKRSHSYGCGQQLEPDTFLRADGIDSGIPHHFFDAVGLQELFSRFRIVELKEMAWEEETGKPQPHVHSHWLVIVERPAKDDISAS